jgi:hypothetical protein
MSFKKKSNKLKYTTNIVTLDELHHNKINDYVKQNELIPVKKKELQKLKRQMKEMNLKKIISSSDEIIEKSILKETIENLESEIKNMERNTEILDYTDKTINLLVDYYALSNKDKQENRDEIIDISNINRNEKKNIDDKLVQINLLSQKTRKIRKPVQTRKIQQILHNNNSMSKFLGEIDENTTVPELKINKKQLQEKYLIVTDKNYACEKVTQTQSVLCQFCKVDKTLFRSEGRYTCLICGETEYVNIESDIPSHSESANEKQKYPYKKVNHLKERLSQFQSKESIDVPDEICNIIKNQLRKQRTLFSQCSLENIRKILQMNKLTQYYEHIHQIYCKITGAKPKNLTKETEEIIINLFVKLNKSFNKYKPPNRANFLSYSYVLNKIFLILNMPKESACFKLLKSKGKLKDQDNIWMKICRDYNLPFHSSF